MNKNLIALVMFAGLSGVVAHADTVAVASHSSAYGYEGTDFHFDAANGSAWLVVNLVEDLGLDPIDETGHGHGGPNIRHLTQTVNLAGLSYDAAAAQILFTDKVGAKSVCATVTSKHGIFGNKWLINLTGACRVYQVRENRHTDTVYFESK